MILDPARANVLPIVDTARFEKGEAAAARGHKICGIEIDSDSEFIFFSFRSSSPDVEEAKEKTDRKKDSASHRSAQLFPFLYIPALARALPALTDRRRAALEHGTTTETGVLFCY